MSWSSIPESKLHRLDSLFSRPGKPFRALSQLAERPQYGLSAGLLYLLFWLHKALS